MAPADLERRLPGSRRNLPPAPKPTPSSQAWTARKPPPSGLGTPPSGADWPSSCPRLTRRQRPVYATYLTRMADIQKLDVLTLTQIASGQQVHVHQKIKETNTKGEERSVSRSSKAS